MLIVRSEQMTVLGEERFVSEMISFLRNEFPEGWQAPLEELKATVSSQMSKAIGYGLETEHHASCYILAAWLMDDGFDEENEDVHEVLSSPDMAPEEKVQWLEAWVQESFDSDEEAM